MRTVRQFEAWAPARREARFVAWAIDVAVVLLLLPPFVALGGLTVLLQTNWLEVDPSRMQWVWGYVVTLLWLGVPLAYFGLATAGEGTLGARRLRLRVLDAGGEPVSVGRSLWRASLMYPSLGLVGAGGLLAMRPTGLTAHDQWSATRVVERAGAG